MENDKELAPVNELKDRRLKIETMLPTTEEKLAALLVQIERLNDNTSTIKGWIMFFGIMYVFGIVIGIIVFITNLL